MGRLSHETVNKGALIYAESNFNHSIKSLPWGDSILCECGSTGMWILRANMKRATNDVGNLNNWGRQKHDNVIQQTLIKEISENHQLNENLHYMWKSQ